MRKMAMVFLGTGLIMLVVLVANIVPVSFSRLSAGTEPQSQCHITCVQQCEWEYLGCLAGCDWWDPFCPGGCQIRFYACRENCCNLCGAPCILGKPSRVDR